MGCFSSKTKIKPQGPGQYLLNTGIPEFDALYQKCEEPLRVLREARTDLDVHTTDFIKMLGAEKNWERRGNLKEIIGMMLVVLSAVGKGNLDSLGVTYISDLPYLEVSELELTRAAKRMIRAYFHLMEYMQGLPEVLGNIVSDLNKYSLKVTEFTKKVAIRTEQLGFLMKDQLDAIKNTNYNHKEITRAPEELTELLRVVDEAKERVAEACEEAQHSPYSDLLITRGVQAFAEALRKPQAIIERFWPII